MTSIRNIMCKIMNIKILLFYFGLLPFAYTISNVSIIIPKEKNSEKNMGYNIVDSSGNHVHGIEYERPLIPPFFFGLKNDTIFQVRIYPHADSTKNTDSLVVENIFVRRGKCNSWICHYDNGDIRVSKFKKYRHSSDHFLNANENSYWEAEMEMRTNKLYNKDTILLEKTIRFGKMSFVKVYGNGSRY